MRQSLWAVLAGVSILAGCDGSDDRAEQARDSSATAAQLDSGGMEHKGGMAGMPMEGMQMMEEVRAHMDSVGRLPPEQMQAMMARHQAMMSRMMDAMGADMVGMRMSGTPEWNALADSVKRDLAALPEVRGGELSARVRAHAERVERLLAMHQRMMAQ